MRLELYLSPSSLSDYGYKRNFLAQLLKIWAQFPLLNDMDNFKIPSEGAQWPQIAFQFRKSDRLLGHNIIHHLD
jgi:hypothetical protein